jgi:uncharacterized protein (TIGR03067 family)
MKYRAVLVLGAVVLIAAGESSEEAVKKEIAKLQGTWSVVSAEWDGNKAPEAKIKMVKIVFQQDKIIRHQGDKTVETEDYKVDPSKNPKSIDVTYLEGERKGESSQGIYSLDGDTLKICMSYSTNRPTEFETRADSKRHLLVLKREKR